MQIHGIARIFSIGVRVDCDGMDVHQLAPLCVEWRKRMKRLALALLIGCSDPTEPMEIDAPPGDIEGNYAVTVERAVFMPEPCVCGDWGEIDEFKRMTVTRDGSAVLVDFTDGQTGIYTMASLGVEISTGTVEIPPMEWPETQHRTGPLRIDFNAGTVSSEFTFYADGLQLEEQKVMHGQRI